MKLTNHTVIEPIKVLFFTCCLLIVGCASMPYAQPKQDIQAKRFEIAPDKATIYLYRADTLFVAKNARFPITLDGQKLGQLKTGTFFRLILEPGTHDIWSNPDDPLMAKGVYTNNYEANKIYFIRHTFENFTISGASKFEIIQDDIAKKEIQDCDLIIEEKYEGPKLFK